MDSNFDRSWSNLDIPPHSAKEFDRISEMPNAVREIDLEELTHGTNPGGEFQLLIGSIWES
jgi:hypothetical protein